MTIKADTSLREVAFMVCTALDRVGITAVLTGGSAASIWAPEAVQSHDCDFVVAFGSAKSAPGTVMYNLGFTQKGGTYFHSRNPIAVEFPPGPLSVGAEQIERWETLVEGRNTLHVLSPTDSCRDRLAGFYHWHDYASLDQALAIANKHEVNLRVIRQWSLQEGAEAGYREFLTRRRAARLRR